MKHGTKIKISKFSKLAPVKAAAESFSLKYTPSSHAGSNWTDEWIKA